MLHQKVHFVGTFFVPTKPNIKHFHSFICKTVLSACLGIGTGNDVVKDGP